MFKSLQDFFNKKVEKNQDPSEHDIKLATAALLFEVVRSDGRIEKLELVYMGEILRKQFGLSDEELNTLVGLARQASNDATSLQGFTRNLCDNWGNAKRMKLLENLWIVSLADEKIDPHERHIVRKVASLLYLTEMQIVQARENAKRTMGIDDFA